MRNVLFASAFLLLASAAAPASPASAVTLRDEVEVRGNSIYLSDLLPVQAPAGLRTSFQGILVGLAPQPGSTRVIDRETIAHLMAKGADLERVEIPQQIVVRRSAGRITREQVVAAIRAALVRTGLPDPNLQAEDLQLFPGVVASGDGANLEVRRIDFDEALNQAKFLLAERGGVPFLVTAQFHDTNLVQAALQDTAPKQPPISPTVAQPGADKNSSAEASRRQVTLRLTSGALVNQPVSSGPALVEAGKVATLYLNSGTMRMLLDVTALERGSLNQTVRVRLPGTGKILRAQIIGERRLEAIF